MSGWFRCLTMASPIPSVAPEHAATVHVPTVCQPELSPGQAGGIAVDILRSAKCCLETDLPDSACMCCPTALRLTPLHSARIGCSASFPTHSTSAPPASCPASAASQPPPPCPASPRRSTTIAPLCEALMMACAEARSEAPAVRIYEREGLAASAARRRRYRYRLPWPLMRPPWRIRRSNCCHPELVPGGALCAAIDVLRATKRRLETNRQIEPRQYVPASDALEALPVSVH